jgi:hypothetical protein
LYYRLLDHEPGSLVLMTGDGAGHRQGDGLLAGARRLRRVGWAIELIAWHHSVNHAYCDWAAEDPGVAVTWLEDHYREVTFLRDHQRDAERVRLRDRSCPTPIRV